jgi:N6-adenosine-specific RNA methylase IME4
MGELVKNIKSELPATIEGLTEYILIGKQRLKVHRAKIKAIDNIGNAEDARRAALIDGQDAGTSLIYAESQLGVLLAKIDKSKSYTGFSERNPVLPSGIDKKMSHEAQTLSTNIDKVEDMIDVIIDAGKIPTPDAIYKEIKRNELFEKQGIKNQLLKDKELAPLTGKFDVIVIDPPWEMEKIKRDVAPLQVGFDYPTMTIDEIKKYQLPAEDNCHIFMWITHKHLPFGFDIFNSWNIKYICCFVWHKNGGFQPFGLPQYNCEFILYGRIGTPIFIDLKDFNVCFNADRTGHSEKPEEFYKTIRRVTAGKRADIFNRRDINGFVSWGNEA